MSILSDNVGFIRIIKKKVAARSIKYEFYDKYFDFGIVMPTMIFFNFVDKLIKLCFSDVVFKYNLIILF